MLHCASGLERIGMIQAIGRSSSLNCLGSKGGEGSTFMGACHAPLRLGYTAVRIV